MLLWTDRNVQVSINMYFFRSETCSSKRGRVTTTTTNNNRTLHFPSIIPFISTSQSVITMTPRQAFRVVEIHFSRPKPCPAQFPRIDEVSDAKLYNLSICQHSKTLYFLRAHQSQAFQLCEMHINFCYKLAALCSKFVCTDFSQMTALRISAMKCTLSLATG